MKKASFFLAAIFCLALISSKASAQVPILYYDFENNTTRTTPENVVEQAINSGSGAITRAGNTTTISGVAGAGTFNGGSAVGQAASSTNWDASTADPGVAATNYYQFIVNTSGFSQISLVVDNQASATGPARIGVLYSTNGTTFTAVGTALTGNAAFSKLSADLTGITAINNQSSVTIRLYAFAGSAADRTGRSTFGSGGTFRIDNLQVSANSTVAGAGIKTLLDESALFTSVTSGSTGSVFIRVNFTVDGFGTTVFLTGTLAISGALVVSNSAILSCGTGTIPAFVIGTGSFTLNSGTTLRITIATGITPTPTASGNIQNTGARTFDAGANYSYVRNLTGAQITGTGLPTTITGSLIINLGASANAPLTLSQSTTVNGPTTISAGSAFDTSTNTFATGAGVTNNGTFTVNGTFQINSGGFVSGTAPTYSASSLLKYNSGGTYGRGLEWSATSGAGFPNDVQVSNNTLLDLGNGGAGVARSMGGSLTIDAGSTLSMNNGGNQMTQPLSIGQNININGTLTLSAASGGDIKVGGNWTRAAAGVFTPNSRAVFFNGTTTQTLTITGGGTETFNYLLVDKPSGNLTLSSSPATDAIVNATAGDVLQLLNAGGIDLNSRTLTLSNSGGNILASGGVKTITGTGGGTVSITGAKTVTNASGGTLVFASATNVVLSAAVNFGPTLSTINGTLTINSGGSVNTNPPTYGSNSKLVYNCGCTYGRGAEWSATSGPGYPATVQLSNNTTLDLGNGGPGAARQMSGLLIIDSGSTFSMAITPMTAALTVLNDVTNQGTLTLSTASGGDLHISDGNFVSNGTFNPNNRALFFEGSQTRGISSSSGTLTIPYLRINKTGGTIQLVNTDVTTLGPSGGDSIQFTGATSTLTLNGRTLTLGSNIGSIAAGSGFVGSNTSKMSLQDGGSAGAMGTLVFTSGNGLLQNLTMNRTGGSGSVTLGSPLTINGALTLTNGIINTGSNLFTLTDTATATRTAGYVIGTYKKIYAETGSFTYDVGTANGYSPLTANVTGLNGTSDLTVKPTQTAQPQILTPSKALQRYWTLTEGGDLTADLTFSYLDPPDVPGTANETAFIVIKYDGANFTTPTGVVDFINNKFTVPNVSSFSDWTLAEAIAPTAVKLINFDATSDNGLVRLDWNTGYEARNLGFNLYREQNGKRTRVTPSMLAGSALLTGPRSVLTAGHAYTWWDKVSEERNGRAQYWLEDVDINGTRTLHGPIVPSAGKTQPRKIKGPQAEVLGQRQQIGAGTGIQINGWPAASSSNSSSDSGEVRAVGADGSGIAQTKGTMQAETPGIGAPDGPPNAGPGPLPTPQYIESDTAVFQRQIADMAGVKFNVGKAGWYRIAQPELIAAGLDSNVIASHLQLYAGGVEVPMRVSGNGQQLTASDIIEFYGTAAADLPTDGSQTYYLVQGQGYGKRIMKFVDKDAPPIPPPGGPNSFAYTLERKERLTYFPGLDNGEADNFFGQIITNNSSSPVLETLNVKHPDPAVASGAQAQLEISLQGVTAGSHPVHVLFNGTDAGVINFAGTDHIVQAINVPASNVIEGDNVIQLASLGGDADISLADTVRLTYAHAYVADNDALHISVGSEDTVRVKGFTNNSVRVVDITDPNNSQELTPVITAQPDGSFSADTQAVGANANGPRTLIVFADTGAAHPDSLRNSNPSHWAAEDAGADFLIISHSSLMGSVQPLADLRRSQGMTVDVIDVEDIYDEFSFGAHSPQAIHEFIKRAANSWKVTPRYVLLVGDATYDPRNYLGQGANDMVPTKLLWATDMKTASDDWMADFDGDSVPELAVGRLPVRTASEAGILVSKIVNYVPGQSAQGALLVADHAGDNDFEGASSALGHQLPTGMPVQVVNRGTQDANTVRNLIINNLNQGPQVVNYFGHGSVGLWTGAGLLTTGDAANLQNGNRLPLFTMMTCLNGYFHDVSGDSLAEALLKSPNGGAVAVWASSGQTNMEGQLQVAQPLYQLLFGGQPMTLGDAVRGAKNATNDQGVRRSWIFFGDPTQRIR